MRPSRTALPPAQSTMRPPTPEMRPSMGEKAAWVRARRSPRARYSRLSRSKARDLAHFHGVRADDGHAAQVLLHLGGQRAQLLLKRRRLDLDAMVEAPREHDEQRRRREGPERQARVDGPHGRERAREGEGRAHEHHGAEARERAQRLDVVRRARHEVARAVGQVEGRRQASRGDRRDRAGHRARPTARRPAS